MNTACVDPSIVKVEERAYGNGEIDRVVVPGHFVQGLHVMARDSWRIAIDLVDEAEQGLVLFVQSGGLQSLQDAPNQFLAAQKFRRNCGVRLQSKRAIVSIGGIRRNQLANPGAERPRASQDLLSESGQVFGSFWKIGEHVPDLRILAAVRLHHVDAAGEGTGVVDSRWSASRMLQLRWNGVV